MAATILVVEDDASVAETIRDVLVAAGYDVPETASSGSAALESALRIRPALVLMDVGLDGAMDGIEAAALLRQRVQTRIIYITAFTDDETLRRAKETAPLGYLRKPFNARELRIAVEIALHRALLEDAIVAREKWFATTLQSIGDGVLTTDAADRVTFVNSAAAQMLGVAHDQALGKKVDDIVRFVNPRGETQPALTRLTPVGLTRADALPRDARLLVERDGREEPLLLEVEGSLAPIALDASNTYGNVMVFRDVGEKRKLERRLGVTERMAAIGTMVAGMQHEINNPLASVVANVQFVLDALRVAPNGLPKEAVAELVVALSDAAEGSERIRRTVEDLRHFSRSREAIDAPVDLMIAIDEAVRVTQHAVRHTAKVKKEYGATPRVLAEEGQLLRVFMNLLLNAARNIGDGGAARHTILIRTRTDGARVVAEVTDDGPGVSDEVLRRIFDPFFTSLPENAELGLGLAICHGIVTSLGGEIEAESELGRGTTFRVLLPAAKASQAPSRKAPTLPPAAGGVAKLRARVLVVDDEVAIGKAIRRILSTEHDVTLESDARIALERLTTETYDVVFCDLMMPNMSGMDFFDELSRRSPDQAERIVFLTGGAFSPRSEEFLRSSRNVCLSKPFSRDAVSSVVRTMIAPA